MKTKIIFHGIVSGIIAAILLGILASTLGSIAANSDPTDVSGLYVIAMPILFGPFAILCGLVISFLLLRKSASVSKLLALYVLTFIAICGIRYAYAGTIA